MENNNRFVCRGDYTIVDRKTGLEWQRLPSQDPMVWKEGFNFIENLNKNRFGGYSDWRYPSKEELSTLILPEEDRTSGLFINKVFGAQRNFWSSTELDHDHHRAAYADFYYGDMYTLEENYANYYVRAVRTAEADK
jgi:serine/threonine-protein kinase